MNSLSLHQEKLETKMILDELKLILTALSSPEPSVRNQAMVIIKREINLKTMDPRKSKDEDFQVPRS